MIARFGIGSVFATSTRIWARNLPRFIAITAVLYLPEIAWFLAWQFDPFRDVIARYYDVFDLHPVLRALPGGWFVSHTCTAAAVTHGTLVALAGQPAPIGRGLKAAVRRFFPVIGVALVVWLATSGVVTALSWLGRWPRPGELMFYGPLLCYVVLLSLFYLAVPIATVERRAVIGSIVRGFGLARGNRTRVFAIVLVWQVVLGILYALTSFVVFSEMARGLVVRIGPRELYFVISLGRDVVLSSPSNRTGVNSPRALGRRLRGRNQSRDT